MYVHIFYDPLRTPCGKPGNLKSHALPHVEEALGSVGFDAQVRRELLADPPRTPGSGSGLGAPKKGAELNIVGAS